MQTRAIEVCDVSVQYADGKEVLGGMRFHVGATEFVAILGPTGCGKSTLLQVIAGFLRPTSGSVLAFGTSVQGPGPDRAFVTQTRSLFPWLTILENVVLPARLARKPADLARANARKWLDVVGLGATEAQYPDQISVGMRQRAALARLIAGDAAIFLMDEPFGALDARSRTQAQLLLLSVWQERRRAVLFVTHDTEEALLLADRILIFGASPARVAEEFPVLLPRPRRKEDLFTKETIEARKYLLSKLER